VSTFPFKFRSVQTPKTPLVTALHKTDEKVLGILKIHLHSVIKPFKYSLLIIVRICSTEIYRLERHSSNFLGGGKAPRPPYWGSGLGTPLEPSPITITLKPLTLPHECILL